MREFNELCREVEQLSAEEYFLLLTEKSAEVVPALSALTIDGLECTGVFASFVIASVYADGKLDESEYLLIYPLLKIAFGADYDFTAAKEVVKAFRPEGKELKKLTEEMIALFGLVSEELKNDIILLCLLICGVDGKISLREKAYIKRLVQA